jgi:hypothetical protein
MASLVVCLAGCSDTATSDSQDAGRAAEPPATVFDPMTSTMDRAAAVEGINMDRKDEMDKAIDGTD